MGIHHGPLLQCHVTCPCSWAWLWIRPFFHIVLPCQTDAPIAPWAHNLCLWKPWRMIELCHLFKLGRHGATTHMATIDSHVCAWSFCFHAGWLRISHVQLIWHWSTNLCTLRLWLGWESSKWSCNHMLGSNIKTSLKPKLKFWTLPAYFIGSDKLLHKNNVFHNSHNQNVNYRL